MSNKTLTHQSLIAFLDGELIDQQQKDVAAQVACSYALQQELENLQLTRNVVRTFTLQTNVAKIRAQMKGDYVPKNEPVTNNKQGKVINIQKVFLRIAASVALLIGIFTAYLFITVNHNSLYSKNLEVYNNTVMRGDGANSIDQLYNNGKYNETIVAYRKLSNVNYKDIFLAGQSFLNTKNYSEAIACFTAVIDNNTKANTSILKEDAEYYLAFAYLINNDIDKATNLFKQIQNNKLHSYNTKISDWFMQQLRILSLKK